MTAERTDRHTLPLIQAGQAQKEMTHNEALVRLDMLVMPAVEGIADVPPASPVPGQCWIVGPDARDAFADHAHAIAGWTANGWRFAAPRDGFRVFVADARCHALWRDAAWQIGIVEEREIRIDGARVLGARQPPIGRAAGGDVRDAEARNVIDTIIATLEAHGLVLPA